MLAYTALMKAVLRESPRVGALGLYALPLLVYLQQQMHTLSACASATLHHCLTAIADAVPTDLLQHVKLQIGPMQSNSAVARMAVMRLTCLQT